MSTRYLPECEVQGCEQQSRQHLRDLTEEPNPDDEDWAEFSVHSNHHFCDDHSRKSRTYRRDPETREEWLYEDEFGNKHEQGDPVYEHEEHGAVVLEDDELDGESVAVRLGWEENGQSVGVSPERLTEL